jgi:hypothetical protein
MLLRHFAGKIAGKIDGELRVRHSAVGEVHLRGKEPLRSTEHSGPRNRHETRVSYATFLFQCFVDVYRLVLGRLPGLAVLSLLSSAGSTGSGLPPSVRPSNNCDRRR